MQEKELPERFLLGKDLYLRSILLKVLILAVGHLAIFTHTLAIFWQCQKGNHNTKKSKNKILLQI